MAYIGFHAIEETVEVAGPERHHAARIVADFGLLGLALDRAGRQPEPIRHVLDPSGWVFREGARDDGVGLAERLELALRNDSERLFVLDGRPVDGLTASLNTAIALGADPVRLLARLHAQCEAHCFVEGGDRAWLADVVAAGRACGLLRAGMGWEAVVALLRSRDDGPVVCSYSVTDSFPSLGLCLAEGTWTPPLDRLRAERAAARERERGDHTRTVGNAAGSGGANEGENEGEDEDEDALQEQAEETWYALPWEIMWAAGVQALRCRERVAPYRLDPARWGRFIFGDGTSTITLRQRAEAIDRAARAATPAADAPARSIHRR